MEQKNLVLALIGAAAAFVAYRVYELVGVPSAIAALLIISWTLFYLRTSDGVLNALEMLLNPFHTGINFLLGGFILASYTGRNFWSSVGIGIAASVLGAIVSMWIYKYWTIGDSH